MVAVVRLLNVTITNPLPPSVVLQSRVTPLGLGCCAKALDPGEQKNVAANAAAMTNIVGRFIEFSFDVLNVSSELASPHLPPGKHTFHWPVRELVSSPAQDQLDTFFVFSP
jgi:hypothetical protein